MQSYWRAKPGVAKEHARVTKAKAELALIERWGKLGEAERRQWWTMLEPAQRRVLKDVGLGL